MRKFIGIAGGVGGIGVLFLKYAVDISNLFGLFQLPGELREALIVLSHIPTGIAWVGAALGLICAGYLVYDSGHHTLALAAIKGRTSRVEHSHLIIGGIGVIVAGVLIGVVMLAAGFWMQSKASTSAIPAQAAGPTAQQEQPARQLPQDRRRQLSRTDYEKRSRLIIDCFQLVNTQVRGAFDELWGIYNDQPRLINSNQKGVYDTMVSARAKLIEAEKVWNLLVRESELYPDIRGLNWNYQSPILQSLNELIIKLRVPVGNNTLIFIDSKETDQLKQGIDVLGKWIEDTKAALKKIRESDDAAVIVSNAQQDQP
jgi:hypothetical protein